MSDVSSARTSQEHFNVRIITYKVSPFQIYSLVKLSVSWKRKGHLIKKGFLPPVPHLFLDRPLTFVSPFKKALRATQGLSCLLWVS